MPLLGTYTHEKRMRHGDGRDQPFDIGVAPTPICGSAKSFFKGGKAVAWSGGMSALS